MASPVRVLPKLCRQWALWAYWPVSAGPARYELSEHGELWQVLCWSAGELKDLTRYVQQSWRWVRLHPPGSTPVTTCFWTKWIIGLCVHSMWYIISTNNKNKTDNTNDCKFIVSILFIEWYRVKVEDRNVCPPVGACISWLIYSAENLEKNVQLIPCVMPMESCFEN